MNANGMDAAVRLIITSDSESHHESQRDDAIFQTIKIVSPYFIGLSISKIIKKLYLKYFTTKNYITQNSH